MLQDLSNNESPTGTRTSALYIICMYWYESCSIHGIQGGEVPNNDMVVGIGGGPTHNLIVFCLTLSVLHRGIVKCSAPALVLLPLFLQHFFSVAMSRFSVVSLCAPRCYGDSYILIMLI